MTALHDLTLSQAARQLRDGTITAVALAESVLDRIGAIPAEHNPYVLVRDRARVLQQAAAADRARADGLPLGPLHGIPFALKDLQLAQIALAPIGREVVRR